MNKLKSIGVSGSETTAKCMTSCENRSYNFQARWYVGTDDGCKLARRRVEVRSANFVEEGGWESPMERYARSPAPAHGIWKPANVTKHQPKYFWHPEHA